MPGEFFFMAMGGLGVSLAGFAGLIAALTPEQQRTSAVARWRIGRVVVWGFHLTFLGFGVIAIYAFLEDVPSTVRVASGFAALLLSIREWRSTRPGPAWPDERQRRFQVGFAIVSTLALLANVVVASLGYLHLIMLGMLMAPTSVFISAVRDATADPDEL
jgi:hypothetical protein